LPINDLIVKNNKMKKPFEFYVLNIAILFCMGMLFISSNINASDLRGTVVIKKTALPVKKATVICNNQTVKTDRNGEFLLKNLNGSFQITISKKGYNKFKEFVYIYEDLDEIYELELKSIIKASAQKVYADREKEKLSFYKVKQKAVKRLSENNLFADTINSLKMLPGVGGNGSFDASMYVRGGNSYEIIGILDNTPIYRPYFFGGRLSIFNPKIVESVDFYPGGYDASYGQSLSGIIDVKTIDGNFEEFQSELETNLTDLNYYVTCPNEKGKSTWMASYRRTYYDLVLPLAASLAGIKGQTGVPYLQAFQTKYTDKLNSYHKLRINIGYFNDGANMEELSSDDSKDTDIEGSWEYIQSRFINSIQLESILNKKAINELTLSFNKLNGFFKLSGNNLNVDSKTDLTTIILRDDISFQFSDSHKLESGILFYKAQDKETNSMTWPPNPYESGSTTINMSMELEDPFYIAGAYLQDKWSITPQTSLTYGARLDYTKVGRYGFQPMFQPRISGSYELDNTTKFKAYYGKYSQLKIARNTIYSSPNSTDAIQASLADVSPEIAWHYGLGLEKYLTDKILFKTEVFYKDYEKMVINMGDYPIDNQQNMGDGKAGGLELMLQKVSGDDYDGWLTYTYSKTRREDKDGWYIPDYDLTHMINVYGDFKVNSKESFIVTLKYNTGHVYTPILGSTTNQVTGAEDYTEGDRFSKRMPDYFRIDAWYEWEGVDLFLPIPFLPISEKKFLGIFPSWHFNGATHFGFFNILNNINAVGTYWDKNNKEQCFISDLPRMPIFGYRIDF
jgi:hypothetical protein